MNINLKLEVKSDVAKDFYEAILPDFKKLGRSNVEIILDKEKLTFDINSKDFTSIRASINGILLKLRLLKSLKEME